MFSARTILAVTVPVLAMFPSVGPAVASPAGPSPEPGQLSECAAPARVGSFDADRIPAVDSLKLPAIHDTFTGRGQTVAVLDSGVSPDTGRFRSLSDGGDLLGSETGLSDCDLHGTAVASIIAATPSTSDGFVGVAPNAKILSIRTVSSVFGEVTPDKKISTMAKGIIAAADSGATVIVVPVAVCVPVNTGPWPELEKAVHHAVDDMDAVIVAGAGAAGGDLCPANTVTADPGTGNRWSPAWGRVNTVSLPAYFSESVLSVAATDLNGRPAKDGLSGPWVSVGAPGTDVSFISRDGSVANGWATSHGDSPAEGSVYAAAYAAGLAALVRESDPRSAREILHWITQNAGVLGATATNTSGAGMINPEATLFGPVPSAADTVTDTAGMSRTSVIVLTAGIVAVILAFGMLVFTAKHRRS